MSTLDLLSASMDSIVSGDRRSGTGTVVSLRMDAMDGTARRATKALEDQMPTCHVSGDMMRCSELCLATARDRSCCRALMLKLSTSLEHSPVGQPVRH